MSYSKNAFAGFRSRVPANWLRGETTLGVHFCYCLKFLPQADLPKMAAFLRLRLKVYGIAIALYPSGKIPSEEKNHGNTKRHKMVKARLDSHCFS
jgi:hypothetical protein